MNNGFLSPSIPFRSIRCLTQQFSPTVKHLPPLPLQLALADQRLADSVVEGVKSRRAQPANAQLAFTQQHSARRAESWYMHRMRGFQLR